MPLSNGAFTLTINTNASFTESHHGENAAIRDMLEQVGQAVGSGRASGPILDRNHNNVGSYTFGAGMINAGR